MSAEWGWVELSSLLATMMVASILMTGRSFLTLLVLFALPQAWFHALESGEVASGHASLVGVLAFLSVVEHSAWSGAAAEVFLEVFQVQGLLLIAGAWAWLVVGGSHDLTRLSGATWMGLLAVLAVSVLVYVAVSWGRLHVWRFLHASGLSRWATWLESLGVLGLGLIAGLAPIVAGGAAMALAVPLVVGPFLVGTIDRARDRRRRRPCPECGHAVRVEASRCPSCLAHLDVQRPLNTWGLRLR